MEGLENYSQSRQPLSFTWRIFDRSDSYSCLTFQWEEALETNDGWCQFRYLASARKKARRTHACSHTPSRLPRFLMVCNILNQRKGVNQGFRRHFTVREADANLSLQEEM
jgi:hypothetical protein